MTQSGSPRRHPDREATEPKVGTGIADLLTLAVAHIGGEPREGQLTMAAAVWDCLSGTGGTLLAQAGTGTGKSVAYAVPAVAHALATDEPVIIATATLALQRQLAEKDMPAICAALADQFNRPVTFALAKGRSNYVCLDKLVRGSPGDPQDAALFQSPTTRLGRQARRLREWADQTETGDRDDLDAPVDARVWAGASVSARECLGAQACSFAEDCFAERARVKARTADVVITNHAMLAIDIQGDVTVLPTHSCVIVDEGHELIDRVTTALTKELSVAAVERALRIAGTFLEPDVSEHFRDAAGFLGDTLAGVPAGRLRSCEGELLIAVTAVRDSGHEALAGTRANSTDDAAQSADRARARAVISAIHSVAADLLSLDQSAVAWLEKGDMRAPVLHVAPLSVRELLGSGLFASTRVVLTSATLSVGGGFESLADAIGCEDPWTGIDVGSPFDYAKQGILYCPAHLPRPGRDGVSPEAIVELGDLIEAAGGRTLALFSSWRGVERAFEELARRFSEREDLPILRAEKGDAIAALVRSFADIPRACLLGTLSLWQGVDVPGPSCTLVAIDRIPFPRPDEPLVAARQERVDKEGGSGFASVSVPRAALLLAQGSGRLIRSREDRGVVAVLDSRFATAGYSGQLRKSMPPFWWSTNPELVRASLRRLDESLSVTA